MLARAKARQHGRTDAPVGVLQLPSSFLRRQSSHGNQASGSDMLQIGQAPELPTHMPRLGFDQAVRVINK